MTLEEKEYQDKIIELKEKLLAEKQQQKKYLMQQRMEKARKLLEAGNGSIGEICDAVGIHNLSYFSHLFKQYTGKLPSEYKKEYHS